MRKSLLQPHRLPRRAGFTLIEVLVVIAIISVLMALVASGVFQYIATQKQANTETLIRTLDKILNKHWEQVVSDAKKEVPSPAVVNLANGDMRVAQVIWAKLRLVEAFPMSFAEVWNQPLYNLPKPGGVSAYIPPQMQKNLATYKKTLASVTGLQPVLPNPPNGPGATGEPIVCLLLALQQSRGGTSLQLDSIAYALADANIDQFKLKMAVDGWHNALVFFRFPAGPSTPCPYTAYPPSLGHVPPYYTNQMDFMQPFPSTYPPKYKLTFRDPLDPEGLLANPQWNNPGNPNVSVFEQLCHNVHAGAGSMYVPGTSYSGQYIPVSYYTGPALVSCGPDGALGLNPDMTEIEALPPGPLPRPWASDDNISSYRLRLGARGD